MNQEELKQRLIELYEDCMLLWYDKASFETIADHLIANGVTIRERGDTADIVEVVRCKDCVYSHFNSSSLRYSCHREWNRRSVEEDDFCNYGKPQKRSDAE